MQMQLVRTICLPTATMRQLIYSNQQSNGQRQLGLTVGRCHPVRVNACVPGQPKKDGYIKMAVNVLN